MNDERHDSGHESTRENNARARPHSSGMSITAGATNRGAAIRTRSWSPPWPGGNRAAPWNSAAATAATRSGSPGRAGGSRRSTSRPSPSIASPSAREAAGVGDRVTGERHDLARTFPSGRFDLVGAYYLHTRFDFPRARVLQAAARAVAPGGLLLIVEHASVAPWSWDQDQRFPSPEETLASLELDLAEWEIERLAAPSREATGPGGQVATVTDNIVAIRRLTA